MKRVFGSLGLSGFLILAACSEGPEDGSQTQRQAAEGSKLIECALGEGSEFGADCLVESESMAEGEELIIRHPDGGFRRFMLRPNAGGLVELDGADKVKQTLVDGKLEVEVGDDRYRFPAAPTNAEAPSEGADQAEDVSQADGAPQSESSTPADAQPSANAEGQ